MDITIMNCLHVDKEDIVKNQVEPHACIKIVCIYVTFFFCSMPMSNNVAGLPS